MATIEEITIERDAALSRAFIAEARVAELEAHFCLIAERMTSALLLADTDSAEVVALKKREATRQREAADFALAISQAQRDEAVAVETAVLMDVKT